MSLRQQAYSGIRWTTLSSAGRAALQFVQVIALSRLLAPADFGLVALAASTVAFLQIFADGGISNAIIHQRDITAEQTSSIYWFNIASSSAMALLLLLACSTLSAWFGQPALTPLLELAAVTLIITALAQQLKIQAQKRLEFQSLAKIDLAAAVGGFAIALALAWQGAGAVSLMAGTLTTASISTLLAWIRLARGWRPMYRLRFAEIRGFIRFGLYMIGNNLANTFNSQIDIFLGSKLLGPELIGLYSVPKELNLRVAGLINPIITQVSFPIMAKAQDDTAQLRRIYLQVMLMTASVNFPIYVFLGVFAEDIVALVLGPRWGHAVQLMQILSAWALIRSTGNPVGSLLMAKGRPDLSFKWNLAMLMVMPPAIWVGSQFGVVGMSLSMATIMLLGFWPNWRFQVKPLCDARFIEYTQQVIPPLMIATVSALLSALVGTFFSSPLTRLPTEISCFASIYVLISFRANKTFIQSIRSLVSRKK